MNVSAARNFERFVYASVRRLAQQEPHVLHYTHKLKGEAEAEISVRFDGTKFSTEIKGWSIYSGTRYTIHLKANGQTSAKYDYHGHEIQTDYDLKGTIKGGDMEIDVDERHSYTSAAATNLRLLHSQRGGASRFTATLKNVLRAGGSVYQLKDVKVQNDTKTKGFNTESALTHVGGEILRDGKPYGRCVLQLGKAILVTSSGSVPLDLPLPKPKPKPKDGF